MSHPRDGIRATLLAAALVCAQIGAAPARAATVTPDDVHAALLAFVRAHAPAGVQDLRIDDLNVDQPRDYPADELALRFRPRAGDDLLGRTLLTMEVVAGSTTLGTRNLSFVVHGDVEVWTLAGNVERGAMLADTAVRADLRDVATLPVDAVLVGDALGPSSSRRSLRIGEVLTRSMLERLPDRPRGSVAVIRVESRGLTAGCMGVLLQDGFVGEHVRARCDATGNTVVGRLGAGGSVDVELPDLDLFSSRATAGGVR